MSAIDVQFWERKQALSVLYEQLGIAGTSNSTEEALDDSALIAEILRSILWVLSCEGTVSVHIVRLLNYVTTCLTGVYLTPTAQRTQSSDKPDAGRLAAQSTGSLRELTRQKLEDLETIQDFICLPRGYWLPTPLRHVPLKRQNDVLIVGGVPTRRLFQHLDSDAIRISGHTRHTSTAQACLLPYCQDFEEWCGIPAQDLQTWTQDIIEQVTMVPGEQMVNAYSLYVPSPENMQYYRWQEFPSSFEDGYYLLRQKTLYDSNIYYLGRFEHGQLTKVSLSSLQNLLVRRLQYGFDLLTGYPTEVHCRKDAYNSLFVLRNALPHAEQRLFTALGSILPNEDGKYYPRRWLIHSDFHKEAIDALRHLGIRIE